MLEFACVEVNVSNRVAYKGAGSLFGVKADVAEHPQACPELRQEV